ncbi:thioredoxin domain-containing protein [Winogradskyella sp. UBA3174]|uniref:thioredoxin domain-containing protein n=1 Tax=Winogradskyella sp. UBA3174 TaxID=1947785 RepID=UPI0025FC89BA|nr:thioredoxin domain-containing protein [Winogradskyella sp. UBA3174]|tara:strand:+ start:8481 stop:10598 length:2118 start_codon:yes stop_codon:yes gene_type:complete
MLKKTIGIIVFLVLAMSCSQGNKTNIKKGEPRSNDLINETSPYLLQHAYNPVDWKAWNNESLKLAKEQNKLIVISVGYSACHWCHVMEEESFENDSVAKLMNENFINIKVDREERPDIDQIYMNAVQLMTGSGGWPLNCITLPDGRPVFGGTYFTKEQWTKILIDMSSLYENNPDKVVAYAEKLTEGINSSGLIEINTEKLPFKKEQIKRIVNDFKKVLDFKNGGQKRAPKFPMPSNLNFLLRYSFQNDDKDLQEFVITSLTKMANGGIYDQIGGGFSRYSVDERWHVPHFEKMLYDNAQLVSLYSKAFQLTKNESFKTVVEETLAFVEDEFEQEEGAFYSSLDADSKNSQDELEEGIYYVWTKDQLKSLLVEEFNLFKSYYNINSIGKWEKDHYILYKTKTDKAFSDANSMTLKELQAKVKSWKSKLHKERSLRDRPRTDDKILTSWNALMLKAYVDAYRVFGEESYLDKAIKNAEFIKEHQIKEDNSLFHNYKDGKSTIEGFSEDYAHTISAYLELYQATFNEKWLKIANDLLEYTIAHFLNKETSMFFFTSVNATNLIARKSEVLDNVIASSNSVLAESLFKLGHYYSNKTYLEMSKQMLSNVNADIEKSPTAYSNWLKLYLNYSNPYYEVAISGSEAQTKLKELDKFYMPNILISASTKESSLPLLENKYIENETYIYVCINGTCKLPVTSSSKAREQVLK